jgi:hypothetical protein
VLLHGFIKKSQRTPATEPDGGRLAGRSGAVAVKRIIAWQKKIKIELVQPNLCNPNHGNVDD